MLTYSTHDETRLKHIIYRFMHALFHIMTGLSSWETDIGQRVLARVSISV